MLISHTILWFLLLSPNIKYYNVPSCAILCYRVLSCAIFCYPMLSCAISCWYCIPSRDISYNLLISSIMMCYLMLSLGHLCQITNFLINSLTEWMSHISIYFKRGMCPWKADENQFKVHESKRNAHKNDLITKPCYKTRD